jgi:hypothetical protein
MPPVPPPVRRVCAGWAGCHEGEELLALRLAVLERASRSSNQLRSLQYEYYPDALAAFEPWKNGLCRPEARQLLKAALARPGPPG